VTKKKFTLKISREETSTPAEPRKLVNIELKGRINYSSTSANLSPKPSALNLLKKPYLTPPISIKKIKENRKEVIECLKER